ncbi:hypothetical protein JTB14_037117 [Gonioctena quinquepunctata]|nr:hypothetical protein JTB14_037117 [Gonioctena quinquepunctata]
MDTEYPKFDANPKLLPNNEKYRKTEGALYLSTTTRPDISPAVGYLCRRVSQPSQKDWYAVKYLQYLKGTSKNKLKFSSNTDLTLKGYVASDLVMFLIGNL